MVDLVRWLFWISLSIILYTYIGYGVIMVVLVSIRRALSSKKVSASFEPAVTLVIAAYNEEDYIEKKIQNTFELEYPPELLNIIFITDGSTDRTAQIIEPYPVKLLHQPQRRGKVAAMNRAIQFVTTPIVIFCDANTLLNKDSIRALVQHFADPEVGGVAGEKKIIADNNDTATAAEGLYWKYESLLKKLDSSLNTVVGAAGELFAIRTDLFEPISEDTVIEDFVQSLKLCMKGYKVKYEPGAYALETASTSIKEEMKRKSRICAGAFQAMIVLKPLLNVFRFPLTSFQYVSHRLLRWTMAPLALPLLLICNVILALSGQGTLYQVSLMLQLVFYAFAALGLFFASKKIRAKLFYVPFYFLFMNVAVYVGFQKFLSKKQTVLWEKAARRKLA